MTTSLFTITLARTQQSDPLTRRLHLTLGSSHKLTVNQDVCDYDAEISKQAITVADIQDIGYLIATTFVNASTVQLSIDDNIAAQYSHQHWFKWLSFGLALSNYNYRHSDSPLLQPIVANFSLLNATDDDNRTFENGKILAYSQLISRE